MKKLTLKRILPLALALVLALSLFGCGGDTASSSTAAPAETSAADGGEASDAGAEATGDSGTKVIGYALKTLQEEFWQGNADAIQAAVEAKGYEFVMQVANNDSSLQISQIENLCTQGIDMLFVTAVDGGSLTTTLDSVHEQGIFILNYDQVLTNAYCDVFIGYENIQTGNDIAKAVAALDVDGNYVFLYGDQSGGDNIIEMSEGMKALFQEKIDDGRITIVSEQFCKEWKAEEGQAHMENALSANGNDIQAVICMNDGIASGAINALASQGMAGDVPVCGMDGELTALQRIAEGTQTSTLFKSTKAMAELAVDTAERYFNGEDLGHDGRTINFGVNDVPWVIAEGITVTQENLDEVIIDGGFFTREEIYG